MSCLLLFLGHITDNEDNDPRELSRSVSPAPACISEAPETRPAHYTARLRLTVRLVHCSFLNHVFTTKLMLELESKFRISCSNGTCFSNPDPYPNKPDPQNPLYRNCMLIPQNVHRKEQRCPGYISRSDAFLMIPAQVAQTPLNCRVRRSNT